MKVIFLALFIVAVSAVPLPCKDHDAVEATVNRVPDGAALEVGNVMDKKLKEQAADAVVPTDLQHAYTAVGIAEAEVAAADASSNSNEVSVLDNDNVMPFVRNLHPIPEVLLINPKSEVELSRPILWQPEPKPEQLPVAAPHFNSPQHKDGLVQVQYNGPEEAGMMSTLQDWFNVVVNYFNSASSPAAPVAPVAPIAHHRGHQIQ